jgi:protein gp37/ParB-like chromosome segregation protein Spo0J
VETRKVKDLKPHPENARIYGDRPDAEFVQSIKDQGVLAPLLITHDDRIISGHGRHYGARQAGRDEVPVTVFPSRDELDILEALVVCNRQRRKTNEQLAREARALLHVEQERARHRQKQLAGRRKKKGEVPANLPGGAETGDARDKVGRQLGTSGKKAEQAAAVADALDGLVQAGKQREADQLRSKLNSTSVHGAYQLASEQGYLTGQARGGSRVELDVVPDDVITLARWQKMSAKRKRASLLSGAADSRAGFNFQDGNGIEWALWSWNPVTGCRHNCPYCYARDLAERFYPQKFAPSFIPSRLKAPHNVKVPPEAATQVGHRNVFTCSMADLFGRWVPREWIEAVLAEVRAAPQWNFLLLTKFPRRLTEFEFPDNAWVGTTVDCQARVANAEAAFREVKAGVRWLSCEPLLAPLHFTDLAMFDWVVLGGSSRSTQTPEFRPPRAWVNEIEDAARKAGCKVYEKTNLLERVREYPGGPAPEAAAVPEELQYLPGPKK